MISKVEFFHCETPIFLNKAFVFRTQWFWIEQIKGRKEATSENYEQLELQQIW